jgi:hypothetical protein
MHNAAQHVQLRVRQVYMGGERCCSACLYSGSLRAIRLGLSERGKKECKDRKWERNMNIVVRKR